MKIGGLQRVSLIDYPGKIGAVIFTQGCNFRCGYCHNPELVYPDRYGPVIPEEDVLSFLDKRRGKLEAVTVTGGEPTLQPDLERVLEEIKKRGYLTKLDTNGSKPDVLEKVIRRRLADYLAMDIKGPLKKYRHIASVRVDISHIKRSMELIMASGIPYEFRTTVVRSQLAPRDLNAVAKRIRHARLYVLQPCVPLKLPDRRVPSETPYTPEELSAIRANLEKECPRVIVR
ncbi:MAG: anaerobic ribonucleoside-triphosphate reductase activating protein [Deltaproteobacteria bacterium]|nr:anaerobic ribonucleoside-triphosphate reductase activating protein [Deltaproteobacteria bacterium]